MKTPTMAAITKLQNAPLPACVTTPGAMMNTDDAGEMADNVMSRVPRTLSPRCSFGAEADMDDGSDMASPRVARLFERISKNRTLSLSTSLVLRDRFFAPRPFVSHGAPLA